jgi:hypothetical protein
MAKDASRGKAHPHASGAPARGRLEVAALMVVLGAAAIVYAAALHVVPVVVEPPAAPPAPSVEEPSAPAAAAPSVEDLFPPAPFSEGPSPPAAQPEPAKELAAVSESEPNLVREVTVGGVVRTPAGEIKRTYSGSAPALCPT